VLDIGCNAGFYAGDEAARRRPGAGRRLRRPLSGPGALRRRGEGRDIEFRKLSVYDVAELGERFDIVLFMGVLYHLRHPLLALDLIHDHVAGDLMVFQSMQRGSPRSMRRCVPITTSSKTSTSTIPAIRRCTSSSTATRATGPTGGRRTQPARRPCCAAPASKSSSSPRRGLLCRRVDARGGRRGLSGQTQAQRRTDMPTGRTMIEAVKIWNEPNNKSHWDPNLDPEWDLFAEMTRLTGQAIAAENPG
jgi:hypothetical protein